MENSPPDLTPKQQQISTTLEHKWATFTYVDKETTYITNIFKHSGLRVAYRTNNTIRKHLIHKNQDLINFHCQNYTD